MNTYKNAQSPVKSVARAKVLEAAMKYLNVRRETKLLSLPADNFIFEKMFLDTFKRSKVTTVEQDQSTYKRGLKVAKKLKITHKNEEIFTELIKEGKKYDVIWLDLCGTLRPSLINELIPVMQGRFTEDKAIVALTVLGAREVGLQKYPGVYGFKKLSNFRKDSFPKMLGDFAKMGGCKLEMVDLYSYGGRYYNTSPMNLYTFLLTK